jgi:hypothetical protein
MEKTKEIITKVFSEEELNSDIISKVELCMNIFHEKKTSEEYGMDDIAWWRGGFTKQQVEDIRGGSMPFPYFIKDDENRIVEAYEVVCLSGMASNNGNPDEITVYHVNHDGSKKKLVYKLEKEEVRPIKDPVLHWILFFAVLIYFIYLLCTSLV